MKTTKNSNSTWKIATIIFAAIAFGTSVMAQPAPETRSNNEVNQAFERLETMMNYTEQLARYDAPSYEYDNIRSAWERLEWLAKNTENNIRYRVPAEEWNDVVVFADSENTAAPEEDNLLVHNTVTE